MFKKIAVAAALVIASSSALAQKAPKFYVGAEVSSTKLDGFSGHENGFGAYFGYKFNQNLAIEGGFTRLASETYNGSDIGLNQTSLSVIGTLPLSSGFSLFGRLGYNDLSLSESSGNDLSVTKIDDGVLYGVGLAYAFTPAISARVEVQKPSSDLTKVAAGVSFHF